jgi:hypothetical protein
LSNVSAYGETPLDDDALDNVRRALEFILRAHEPYPAMVLNKTWDLVTANGPAQGLLKMLTKGRRKAPTPTCFAPSCTTAHCATRWWIGKTQRVKCYAACATNKCIALTRVVRNCWTKSFPIPVFALIGMSQTMPIFCRSWP